MEESMKRGMDLIEISPNAVPPVAKIMDYGKFQYQQNKKQKEIKAKSHTTETKSVQIKVGTSEHDLELKAKNVSKWLREGHRVKIDLYLVGRTKYAEMGFKKERLERILNLISEDYKIASGPEKGMKGLTMTIERSGKTAKPNITEKQSTEKNENKQIIHKAPQGDQKREDPPQESGR